MDELNKEEVDEGRVNSLGKGRHHRVQIRRSLLAFSALREVHKSINEHRYLSRGLYQTKERFVVEMERLINGKPRHFKADVGLSVCLTYKCTLH